MMVSMNELYDTLFAVTSCLTGLDKRDQYWKLRAEAIETMTRYDNHRRAGFFYKPPEEPELLRELKRLVEMLEPWYPGGAGMIPGRDDIERARAAIRKAEAK